MTDIERAIFAAAYVDALRNIYDGKPMRERVKHAQAEADLVIAMYRQHAVECAAPAPERAR